MHTRSGRVFYSFPRGSSPVPSFRGEECGTSPKNFSVGDYFLSNYFCFAPSSLAFPSQLITVLFRKSLSYLRGGISVELVMEAKTSSGRRG